MNIEKAINDFLSQLGAGSRETVYLSVTPGVGLEMIQMDSVSKMVKAYASRPLEYNESLREIADYEVFREQVKELFEELNINPKCNVVVNLPMVLFGSISLPLLLPDESITEAITSEVEQSYVFKRHEPVVSWADAPIVNNTTGGDTRKIFYSALQKNAIDSISEALSELGAVTAGVEMSLTSVLKGLNYSGLTEAQMQEGMSWNLMLVNSNGYSIVSMVGKNIVDYYEEPLALKSFDMDEVYNAINASAQITLMSYPANFLYIISDTELVSAELLSKKIQVGSQVDFLENNSFKKQEIVPVSLDILPDQIMKISLEAVGISVTASSPLPVKFDFVHGAAAETSVDSSPVKFKLGDKEIELTPDAARNVSIVVGAVIVLPLLILFALLPGAQSSAQKKLDNLNAQVETIDMQIQQLNSDQAASGNFDAKKEIKTILKNNRTKLLTYSALGEAVTNKVWLTYFMTKEDGKVDIKGEASNVEDVYFFFKNMKDSLINNNLKMHKLEMKSGSIDELVQSDAGSPMDYQFEITNMSDAQLNPAAQTADKAKAKGKSVIDDLKDGAPEPAGGAKKNPLMGTSPIMNMGKGGLPEN